jgi:hypothetical protein
LGFRIGLGLSIDENRWKGSKEDSYPKHSRSREFILQTTSNKHSSPQEKYQTLIISYGHTPIWYDH